MIRQFAIFSAVGSAAAITHLAVVAFAVTRFGIQPLAGNVLGFGVAFCVSYLGHSKFTFGGHGRTRPHAPSRFLLIAATGFTVNQAVYAYALSILGPVYYLPILAGILVLVAGATFAMSKLWAFAVPA